MFYILVKIDEIQKKVEIRFLISLFVQKNIRHKLIQIYYRWRYIVNSLILTSFVVWFFKMPQQIQTNHDVELKFYCLENGMKMCIRLCV